MEDLTSVFGMGTGVAPPLWSPGNSHRLQISDAWRPILKSNLFPEMVVGSSEDSCASNLPERTFSLSVNGQKITPVQMRNSGQADRRISTG